jgi:hypothetical protein
VKCGLYYTRTPAKKVTLHESIVTVVQASIYALAHKANKALQKAHVTCATTRHIILESPKDLPNTIVYKCGGRTIRTFKRELTEFNILEQDKVRLIKL